MVKVVISEGNSSTRRKNIRHEREKRVEWEIREKKNLGSSTFECVAIYYAPALINIPVS
jgi:hypothetical protein